MYDPEDEREIDFWDGIDDYDSDFWDSREEYEDEVRMREDEEHDQAIKDYCNQDWSEPEDYSGLGSPLGEKGID